MKGKRGSVLCRLGIGAALTVLAGSAAAQNEELMGLPGWYAGGLVGLGFPDSARQAKDGLNLHLVVGKVLGESVAVEGNLFATQFDADMAGGPGADLTGGGVDLTLGTPDFGYPLFLLGAGLVQQDIGGVSRSEPYGELGVGAYLPWTIGGELWRVEARYHLTITDHPALPGDDLADDLRLNIGVLFAFGREPPVREPEPVAAETVPEPVAALPPPVVAPVLAPVEAPALAAADEDGDGVPDADDSCPRTVHGVRVDSRGCVVPTDVVLRGAYFGSGSASLTARGYELLHSVAAALKADPAMRLEIEGHTDTTGPADKNLVLSQQRAEVVLEILVSLGVDSRRLAARGYGETLPINADRTVEDRAQNRRVRFRRLDP
ncbi:MAG: OmpA family protein [Nevskiaceae bacterium]